MIKFKLKELLEERNMNMYQLAKKAGLRPNTLSTWYHNSESVGKINVTTLSKVCKELECNVNDLIEYVSEGEGSIV